VQRPRLLTSALAAVLLSLAGVRGAQGDRAPPRARLDYRTDAAVVDCPDAGAMRATIASNLGYDPFRSAAPLRITSEIVADDGGRPLARIRIADQRTGADGWREIAPEENDCVALARSVALAISIAIDPLFVPPRERGSSPPLRTIRSTGAIKATSLRTTAAQASTASAAAAPPPETPARQTVERASLTDAEPPPLAATAAAPAPPTSAEGGVPVRLSLGAGPTVTANLQPGAALGMQLTLSVRRRALGLGLEVQANVGSGMRYRDGIVTGQLRAATASSCLHGQRAQVCALLAAGALRGVASGFRDSRQGLTALAAFGLRVGWQQPLAGRWSMAVQGDALTPIVRTTLWIDDVPIWTMPRIATQVALLGIWTFD
jgi:hypothetical protein